MSNLPGTREPTPDDLAVRDAVLELAGQHAAKALDHWEVRRLCNGQDRYTAVRYTPRTDPSWPALLRMLDDLIAQDPTQQYGWQYRTKHGLFSSAELQAVEAAMVQDADRLLIRFPIGYGPSGPYFRVRAA